MGIPGPVVLGTCIGGRADIGFGQCLRCNLTRDEAGVDPQRTSTVPARCVLVLGGVSVIVALGRTVGPWTVSIGGQSTVAAQPS